MRSWPGLAVALAVFCGCGPQAKGFAEVDASCGGYPYYDPCPCSPSANTTSFECFGVTCSVYQGCALVSGAWQCDPCTAPMPTDPECADATPDVFTNPFPSDSGSAADVTASEAATCGPFPTFHCFSDSDCTGAGKCCASAEGSACSTFACPTHMCADDSQCVKPATCVDVVVEGQTLPFRVCE